MFSKFEADRPSGAGAAVRQLSPVLVAVGWFGTLIFVLLCMSWLVGLVVLLLGV